MISIKTFTEDELLKHSQRDCSLCENQFICGKASDVKGCICKEPRKEDKQ